MALMRAEFVNPFVKAATEVLSSELGVAPSHGGVSLQTTPYTTEDVTALIGVTGRVEGTVMLSMGDGTARGIVSQMMGQEFSELDELAQSGIGELGNVITGRAAVLLAEAGFPSDLAPPMLILGQGSTISTLDAKRLVIPLETAHGGIHVQIALREAAASAQKAA